MPTLTGGPGSDDQLVLAALSGDRDAAQTLSRRYLARVYSLCRRMLGGAHDAEDATQETMLRAMRALHQYRPEGVFERWLLKIATNTCLTFLRRKRPTVSLEDMGPPAAIVSESGTAETDSRIIAVERVLPALSDRQRAVFVLFHCQGWSLREVADVLDMPSGTVRSSLHRARARIRELLEPEQQVES